MLYKLICNIKVISYKKMNRQCNRNRNMTKKKCKVRKIYFVIKFS